MALFKAKQVAAGLPIPTADGARDLVPVFGDFVVPAGFASGDVVEMCGLPAGYVIVDAIIDNAALGTTVTSDVGILTGRYGENVNLAGGARDCGAELMAAQALQTAGIKRMAVAGGGRLAPANDDGSGKAYDRGVGFKATTVSTPTVGAVVRMTLLIRPMLGGA